MTEKVQEQQINKGRGALEFHDALLTQTQIPFNWLSLNSHSGSLELDLEYIYFLT